MYLKKTIVLVVLAATAAAPSALAKRPPEDVGTPYTTIVQHQPAGHSKAKPKVKQTVKPDLQCKSWFPYCPSAGN